MAPSERTELAGRVALVTGGTKGIGFGIAATMARYGADVALNYRGDGKAAEDAARRIRELGVRAVAVRADVADPAQAEPLLAEVDRRLGRLDVLVNNVGDFFFRPLAETSAAEWRAVLDSNLSSVHYLCSAVLPRMRRRGAGKIVNIALAPTYLVRGARNVGVYSIAKTGVQILTRTLAAEEAGHGITVNCVSPGLIDNGYLPPEQAAWMRVRVPMGRLGTPAEIGEAVAFLVSDRASYVSGADLAVSGAWDWMDRPVDHDPAVRELFLGEPS